MAPGRRRGRQCQSIQVSGDFEIMQLNCFTRTSSSLAIVAAMLALGTVAHAQEAPARIAVVDMETVVAESPQGKQLQARLESFQTEVQEELGSLQEQAGSVRHRINEGSNSLSRERLAELEKEYEDATIAMRRYRDDKQREGQKIQETALEEIEATLQPVFAQVREEMNLDLIINRVPGVVLMISERVDITALMIRRLSESAAAPPLAD